MKLTKDGWFQAVKWMGVCLLGMAWTWMANAQAFSTTTVQGTVYLADGQPGAGTLQLSWPAFTTASNQTVIAGRTTVTIGADGFVSVNLAPNQGSTPAGLFYTAVFNLSDGSASTQYWVVPAAAQASLAQVQAQLMPAAQAVQAVDKAYVDQAIQSLSQSSLTATGGTLTGPLYLSGAPTQALQAADKGYVDTTVGQTIPLTGGTMTGALATPALTASVNTQINVMAAPYNAKGDCQTDDSAAIQAAVNAAGLYSPPAVVYFPKPSGGCYLTSTIKWNGAPLQGQQGMGVLPAVGNSGVVIKGQPGQDILHVADPGSVSTAAPANSWSIRDITLQVDDTGTPSFPHRWPGRWFNDAAMTAGSAVLTTAHALISCGDVGQAIQVNGAGASGANLVTAIASVVPCSATPGASSTVITLVATASTSVTNAAAYISVDNLPVTANVGNAAIAFDDKDGNPANWTMTGQILNDQDVLRDVQITSVSGASMGQNSSAGIYTQGAWGMYGLDARNVSISRLVYGVVQGSSELNSYYQSSANDYQRWDHGELNAEYPWISYNGGFIDFEGFQLESTFGPQILQLSNQNFDVPNNWTINVPEMEQNTGSVGWRIEGGEHTIFNTTLAEGTLSTTSYLDANDVTCTNCGVNTGTLQVNGARNTVRLSSPIDSNYLSLVDNGVGNLVTGADLANSIGGFQPRGPAALNTATGQEPVGEVLPDFIQNGNVATPYFNNHDLFFWPNDFLFSGSVGPISTDSTSLTGRYLAWPNYAISSGYTQFEYLRNAGKAMISGTPAGGQVPATNVIVYVSAKCTAGSTYQLWIQAGSTQVAYNGSVACSSSAYSTQSIVANLASYSGSALGFQIYSGSGTVDVAWIAARPYQADVEVSGNVTIGGTLVTVNSGTLSAAEALLPSGGTLVVSGILSVPSSQTVPSSIKIEVKNGGGFNVASGAVLSLGGPFEAGRYPVFSGSGTVSFASNSFVREIYPEWWGADPTGNLDSTSGWQAAVTAAGNVDGFGGVVSCPKSVYSIRNTITSFATNTAQGISLLGPEGEIDNVAGGCSLQWNGVAGGTIFHYLGGHLGKIEGVNFNTNGLAARGLWLDSNNSATAASTSISAISRSGNVVTATLAASETWPSGTDVTVSGVSDPTYNGIFPVWYQADSMHISWSQSGANSSSSGGAAAVVVGGDVSSTILRRNAFWPTSQTGVNISSCSVASNTLSCTLSSPVIIYPNQWVWITGSTDPVYNAYWQVLTVTGPTTFTAAATEVASEAATTSGTFYGQSSGVTIGSNALALVNNSVCCLNFEDNMVWGNVSDTGPWPLFAFEFDGRSNTKDFTFRHNGVLGVRIGWMAFESGTFHSSDDSGAYVQDAIYASSILGTATIEGGEWEGHPGGSDHPYFVAGMYSGSYNAAVQGTAGQFELMGYVNNGGSLTLLNNELEMFSFAPDGVAVSTSATLNMQGNNFYNQASSTLVPLINVSTYFGSTGRQSVFSSGNTFANATPGGWAPFVNNGIPAYGTGSKLGGVPVISIGDKASSLGGTGYSTSLAQGGTLTVLKYLAPPTAAPLDDAAMGAIQLPNNVAGPCWRNAADSSSSVDDCLTANASDQPQWTNQAGGSRVIPTGPATSTSGDVVTFAGTAAQIQDSGKAFAGSGAAITTGPASGTTASHVVTFSGTTGQIQDGGVGMPLSGTTASIGGSALAAGACASGTVSIANSTTSMAVQATPATYPGDGIYWKGYVSAAGTVTVKVCAAIAATPTASTYSVRVIQ